jgi:hypothetical protein
MVAAVSPRLPSLRVSGQRGDKPNEELDLASARAVRKLSDDEEYIALPDDDQICMEVGREFYWEVSEYLSAHYCQLGKTWINPTGLWYLDRQRPGVIHLRHSHAVLTLAGDSFTHGQMAAFIRRAGLVEVNKGMDVSLDEVIEYKPANLSLRFWGLCLPLAVEAQSNVMNLIEVSDWLTHRDGVWSNPAQVRMLNGEGAVFSSDHSRRLDEMTPEAVETVRAMPWLQVDEDTQINVNRILGSGLRRAGDHLAIVLLGAGVQHPISLEMNDRIFRMRLPPPPGETTE